jgi:Fe-S cluster assembly iron-binding protein IscA
MLAITDTAAEAIRTLTTDAELPDGGGLRISAPDPEQGLELSLAGRPDTEDVVLSGDGVSVFLEPVVAQVLDDKVLDVQPVAGADGGQELRFAIGVQEAPEA